MSLDNILLSDWNISRPSTALPGLAATTPMSILDFAMQDGPLDIMPLAALMEAPPMSWSGLIPAVPPRSVPPMPPPVLPPLAVITPKIPAASRRVSPTAEDAADRDRAMSNWCSIFEQMGDAFANARQVGAPLSPEGISVFFVVKSTGTMATRASAWNLFLRYARDAGLDPSALDESAAFAYVTHL